MTKKVQVAVEINRPVNEVFSYIVNLQHMPYYTDIIEVNRISGNGEVGTIYEIVTRSTFSKIKKQIEISKKSAHMQFAYIDKSLNYENETGYMFEELSSGGVKVTSYKSANVGGLYSLLTLNIGHERSVQKELYKSLQTLKKIFEA